MKPSRIALVISLTLLTAHFPGRAAALDVTRLQVETLIADIDPVVAITHAGDERLFLTFKDGRVMIFDDSGLRQQPYLDIRDRVASGAFEQGLLSIAFHPSYAQNGFFYAYYTDLAGTVIISRFNVSQDPERADANSERALLRLAQPFNNHNGGQLQFGPDGYLYAGPGDGGSANDPQCHAQNSQSLLGKLLRLDVDQNVDQAPYHGIPADNPFIGMPSVRDEIWALGLRNPWRFSFDRASGELYIADVGQGQREEVNLQPTASSGGENYGWKMMEGRRCTQSAAGCGAPIPGCNASEYTSPILEYDHGGGNCSITGGYVYRGLRLPDQDGVYFYGDFCSGRLWAAELSPSGWQTEQLTPRLTALATFGEDASGELYLATDDTLYRLVDRGAVAFSARAERHGEGAGTVPIVVERLGGSDGEVRIDFATRDASAVAGEDYLATAGVLIWADGELSAKTFDVEILQDGEVEDDESFVLELFDPVGAVLGDPATVELTIADDDSGGETCVGSTTVLCLNEGRFRVESSWRTPAGDSGLGQAQNLTDESGMFWFFNSENVELVVKVLNGCFEPYNHYWVFAAGLTNVEVELVVTDTATGLVKRYDNELNMPFQPILDTRAFATCP